MNNTVIMDLCMYCGQWRNLVWVHSHYRCTRCLNNAIPSCEGDEIDTKARPVKKKQTGNPERKTEQTEVFIST